MKATLLVRLARLESQTRFAPSAFYEYGWLARLPKEYVGERHRVVIERQPTRSPRAAWCEWEERPDQRPRENLRAISKLG